MSHRLCILWNTISPSCFGGAFSSAAPPPATIPGKAITERRIGVCVGNNSDPVTRVASMKKLLNIVYGIGVAVWLALISFGVWCHVTMMQLCGFLSFSFPSVLG